MVKHLNMYPRRPWDLSVEPVAVEEETKCEVTTRQA